jgi:nucleoside-diphosphate-sugar epimerase
MVTAMPIARGRPPLEIERFGTINRRETRRILEIARQLVVVRFVYLSSIALYDSLMAGARDESGRLNVSTAYALDKLAGERLCVCKGLDWSVARLESVLGSGPRQFR